MCLICSTWVVGALCMPSCCIFCISLQNHLFTSPYPFMNCKLTKTLIPTPSILQLIIVYSFRCLAKNANFLPLPILPWSTHSLAGYLVVQYRIYFPASLTTKCGHEIWAEGCVQLVGHLYKDACPGLSVYIFLMARKRWWLALHLQATCWSW